MSAGHFGGDGSVCGVRVLDVVEIAEEAGRAVLAVYRAAGDACDSAVAAEVQLKEDNSPLTRADREANALICAALDRLRSEAAAPAATTMAAEADASCELPPPPLLCYPILSEENKIVPYDERRRWTVYWCVDPLDGTREFIKRNGEFTVNIALMQREAAGAPAHPVLGVLHAPCLGTTYYAARGHGAWKRQAAQQAPADATTWGAAGASEPIRAEPCCLDAPGLRIVCSRSHLDERTRAFLHRVREPETISMGSSLKFMLIAEGKAHVYPRFAPTSEWDTAASQIVVEEAGGSVHAWLAAAAAGGGDEEEGEEAAATGAGGVLGKAGQRLAYGKEDVLNPYFVAYARLQSSRGDAQ